MAFIRHTVRISSWLCLAVTGSGSFTYAEGLQLSVANAGTAGWPWQVASRTRNGGIGLSELTLVSTLHDLATRNPGKTEADIQAAVRNVLLYGGFDLGEETVRLESPADDHRRLDIEVGALIIECKRSLRTRQILADGETQLGSYLEAKARSGQRYAGILTDGVTWRLYAFADGQIRPVDALTLDASRLDERRFRWWLGAVLATEHRVVPTNATIDERFGARAPSYALTHAALLACWEAEGHGPGIAVKRALWAKLLRSALGTQFEDTDALFVDHTYLVLLATLIGYAIAGFDLPAYRERLRDLLAGQPFTQAGLLGIGQSGFFDWVLDTPDGADIVADLMRRVSAFQWDDVSHDVLKALYQSVIAPDVRKRLGEYYTPDWLARRMVAQVVTEPLGQRVLDPACGSGTFLFHAIRRYLEAADQAGVPVADAVARVTGHVSGVDLHPVAVVLAQTTYLLALGRERIDQRRGALSIPVYLGDSMQWEAATHAGTYWADGDIVLYAGERPGSFDQELRFPESVTRDVQAFEVLLAELVERATTRPPGAPRMAIEGLLSARGLADADRRVLQQTYAVLCDLHDAGRDHIWGFYIRNQARPMWLSQMANRVDVLIGNPPWLAYRNMLPAMQAVFEAWSRGRQLWQAGRRATGQDLSAFFAVRSMELYLRAGGRFGWVMPRAVLSRQPYAGFRTGNYPGNPAVRVAFETPWDLAAVVPAPFPVPAGVLFGTVGGQASALPAETLAWSGATATAEDDRQLASAAGLVAAVTEGMASSPYRARFKNGATLFPRVLVMVTDAPASPLGTPAGHRLVRSRQSSLDKAPWKDVAANTGMVETEFVRPVYLGESIVPFRTLPPAAAVIPYDGTRLLAGDDDRIDHYPGLAGWWRWAEGEWLAHRVSERLSLRERIDYVHGLSSQLPIAPWRVVYTASGTTLAAAVVQDDRAVVEHKLYWAAVETQDEARYLEAVLNAPSLNERVKPFQSMGAFGPRDFDKYMWQAPIPVFDPAQGAHRHVIDLAEQCERVAAAVEVGPRASFQSLRRAVRRALGDHGLLTALDEALTAILPGSATP